VPPEPPFGAFGGSVAWLFALSPEWSFWVPPSRRRRIGCAGCRVPSRWPLRPGRRRVRCRQARLAPRDTIDIWILL